MFSWPRSRSATKMCRWRRYRDTCKRKLKCSRRARVARLVNFIFRFRTRERGEQEFRSKLYRISSVINFITPSRAPDRINGYFIHTRRYGSFCSACISYYDCLGQKFVMNRFGSYLLPVRFKGWPKNQRNFFPSIFTGISFIIRLQNTL